VSNATSGASGSTATRALRRSNKLQGTQGGINNKTTAAVHQSNVAVDMTAEFIGTFYRGVRGTVRETPRGTQ
jgi:hypothetical protein